MQNEYSRYLCLCEDKNVCVFGLNIIFKALMQRSFESESTPNQERQKLFFDWLQGHRRSRSQYGERQVPVAESLYEQEGLYLWAEDSQPAGSYYFLAFSVSSPFHPEIHHPCVVAYILFLSLVTWKQGKRVKLDKCHQIHADPHVYLTRDVATDFHK